MMTHTRNAGKWMAAIACLAFIVAPRGSTRAQAKAATASVSGDWFGAIQAGGNSLRIVIHVKTLPDERLEVTFDSPDQGASGIPGANARLDGNQFSFDLPAAHGSYRGVVSTDGKSIHGTWTQGQPVPLNFTRAASLPPKPATAPPPSSVVERDVTFPTDDGLTAPGTLTMPAHPAGRVPIVVMVQGSGVQDRNETVGPNKIFEDLAWGLGEKGIATLRYDRRPLFAPKNFAQHFDLDHEVTIDAVAALRYVSGLPGIDPARVYLLGHSLGGTMAPYIVRDRLAQQPGSVAGIVAMAGAEIPIDTTMIRQIHDLGVEQGASAEQISAIQEKWREVFAEAKDPKTPADRKLGVGPAKVPAGYWRDWLARDPVAVLKTLHVPVLVLRGADDLNVTHTDFQEFQAAAVAPGSEAKEFPGLNHEFLSVSRPDGSNVMAPGHVSPAVIQTIAEWVRRGSAPPAHAGQVPTGK